MTLRRWAAVLAILLAIAVALPVPAHKGEKHGKAQVV